MADEETEVEQVDPEAGDVEEQIEEIRRKAERRGPRKRVRTKDRFDEMEERERERRAALDEHISRKREHRCRRKIMCRTSADRLVEPFRSELRDGEKPVKLVRINECYDPDCPNGGEIAEPNLTITQPSMTPRGRGAIGRAGEKSLTEGARLS